MWHLECGRDFEVNQNCKKKLPCSLANGPQRIWKEGTAGPRTLLCICYTSVVQWERTVVLQSAELRNFSAAEWGKAIKDNLQNVLHLIFCKLPLDNFPHSVFHKIPAPLPLTSQTKLTITLTINRKTKLILERGTNPTKPYFVSDIAIFVLKPQPFYGTTQVSRCQKRTSGLWCKGRLTEAETPTVRLGATPSGLTSGYLHHPPFFTGWMPFLLPNQQCQSTEGN